MGDDTTGVDNPGDVTATRQNHTEDKFQRTAAELPKHPQRWNEIRTTQPTHFGRTTTAG